MTLLQKLQAILQAMNDISAAIPTLQTELTNFSTFLDTV